MKSIDDIIDNFDGEECPGEQKAPDHLKVQPEGNSSFRSVNVPRKQRAPNIVQASSRSFSAGKDHRRIQTLDPPMPIKNNGRVALPISFPKKLALECSNSRDDEVFSFCGQRLSEFCEKILHEESKGGSMVGVNDTDDKSFYSIERNRFSPVDDLMSSHKTDPFDPTFPVYTQLIKYKTTKNNPLAHNLCINNDEDVNDNDLNHLRQHQSSDGSRIYEEMSTEEPDSTEKKVQSNPNSLVGLDQTGVQFSGPSKSEHVAFEGELSSEIEMRKLNKSGKSRREELISILSDLNDQLEKWEQDKEQDAEEQSRQDSGKFQGRNSQCKSENLEECSVAEISEYSKSLNELTEKLTKFESGRNTQEPSKQFLRPQKTSLEARIEQSERITSLDLKNPSFNHNIGLVKPHLDKKENRPKPRVPPKPKFMKDRAYFSSEVFQAANDSNAVENESLEASDCSSRCSDAGTDSLLYENSPLQVSMSSSQDYQSSSVFSTPPSSSSSASRSFTPSPSPGSRRMLTAFPVSPPSSELPPVNHESPSSTTIDSSFTLSPPSPHRQTTTFSSTKYKLVRPPASLSLSETPSSLSPLSSTSSSPLFLLTQPPPSSCPASVEMGRKKIDKVWIPSTANKSFKVYKISSRGRKSPFGRLLREEPASGMTGSAGNVSNLENVESDPVGRAASTRSMEILPERRDSYASMEKYRALNNSRRAMCKRYELVTLTTKEETVTLKNVDGSKFRRKSLGKTTISNPPASLNAAERLYYLLGGGKEKNEGGNDEDNRDKNDKPDLPERTEMLRVEAYRLPRDQKVREEKSESSYEGLVSSLMSLANDDGDEEELK